MAVSPFFAPLFAEAPGQLPFQYGLPASPLFPALPLRGRRWCARAGDAAGNIALSPETFPNRDNFQRGLAHVDVHSDTPSKAGSISTPIPLFLGKMPFWPDLHFHAQCLMTASSDAANACRYLPTRTNSREPQMLPQRYEIHY